MEDGNQKSLVNLCINLACSSKEIIETWRRQKRTLERLPPHIADALFRLLRQRRLLFPSLLEVFQRCVDEVDLRGESSVDAEWLAYLGGFCNLKSLNLADCRGVNNHAIWPLSGLNSLKELNLSRCSKITDAGIKHVLSIQCLEKLFISETGLTADGIKQLSCLVNLRVLDLGGLPVTDKALSSLQVLAGIEYLDLWGSEVSDVGAGILEMFPRLSFLNLAWTKVTKLPYLSSITCLNMSNCNIHAIFRGCKDKIPLSKLLLTGSTIDDPNEVLNNVEPSFMSVLDISGSSINTFDYLDSMKQLDHLDLGSSRISDNLIEHVIQVGENLKYLNLSKTKITSQAVSILVRHVPNLETISLSYTEIDDTSLSYIGIVTSLKAVDLSHTKIKGFLFLDREGTDETSSLRELQNLSLLENLNLEDTLIRDEAINPLAFLRELKFLYLKSYRLTDNAFHALSSPLPKLQILGFRDGVLSDKGLSGYIPPASLQILDLRGCWLLTQNGIELFCTDHPKIYVRHENILSYEINSVNNSSPFLRSARSSVSKSKGRKPARAQNFVDERKKYSRNDLLEFQFSPLSSLTQQDLNMLPRELRKD